VADSNTISVPGSLGFNETTQPEEKAYLEKGIESTEEAVTDEVPQEQSMPAEKEQAQEAQVEAEPEAEQPEGSLIDRYRSSLDGDSSLRSEVPEESELSRLRQQVSRMEGELKARSEQLDRAITGQPEAPKQEVNEAFDPAVISMLQRIQEEAPEKFGPAVAMVASEIAEKKVNKKVSELSQRFEQNQTQHQTEQQTLEFRQQFHAGLEASKEKLGGVYAEVVEDYNKNKTNSLLFRKLTDNPYLLASPEEAVKAVGVDIQMWNQMGGQEAPAEQAAPGGSSQTAVAGSASERGISLNEPKPEAPDESQQLFDLVKGAATPSLPWE
jgi:hypothetical protein